MKAALSTRLFASLSRENLNPAWSSSIISTFAFFSIRYSAIKDLTLKPSALISSLGTGSICVRSKPIEILRLFDVTAIPSIVSSLLIVKSFFKYKVKFCTSVSSVAAII